MTVSRITAPEPEDSRRKLAARIAGAVRSLFAFLDLHMLPAQVTAADTLDYTAAFEPGYRPPSGRGAPLADSPTLYQIHARRLAAQIRRVEHMLRCLLLILAAKLLADPERRGEISAHRELVRAQPEKRPYDPDSLVQITHPPPRASFASLPRPSGGGQRLRETLTRSAPLLDWKEVDIARLMTRMAQFPKVLTSLDQRAGALAARLLSGKVALTEADATGPRLTLLGPRCGGPVLSRPNHYPAFLRHLAHWLPPPELSEDCHETDRDALNRLHWLASEALRSCVKI